MTINSLKSQLSLISRLSIMMRSKNLHPTSPLINVTGFAFLTISHYNILMLYLFRSLLPSWLLTFCAYSSRFHTQSPSVPANAKASDQLSGDSPANWSASCLPPVRFDLPPLPELNGARDAELLRQHRKQSVPDTKPIVDENTPSGSTLANSDVILVPEELPEPIEMAFLGAVELPDSFGM